jgi:photosystem II stability/assembly factor-like uncharacterized protein
MIRKILLLAACTLVLPAAGAATPLPDTLHRPATMVKDTIGVVLLSIARAGSRLVAVGERGIIVVSDDDGRRWRQVAAPVSVTLTAVRFADERHGWAIGHRGVILKTDDRGATWRVQLDGLAMAAMLASYADRIDQHIAAPIRQLARDGADKPLLDVYFRDTGHGMVVGAYGLAFTTADGGRTWTPAFDLLDNPRGLHLYAIGGNGGHTYIAGEQGLLLQSTGPDGRFVRKETPYRGSYFALAALPGAVVVAGLNGSVFRLDEQAGSWSKPDVTGAATFSTVLPLPDAMILADQAGNLFRSGDQGATFQRLHTTTGFPLSSVAALQNDELIGVGLRGVMRLSTRNDMTGARE